MPTIPIITAQHGPGILDLPAVRKQTGFEEVTQLGESLVTIDEKIQKARSDSLLVGVTSQFDAGLKDLTQQAHDNPDYANRVAQFIKDSGDLSSTIGKNIQGNRAVEAAFLLHQQRVLPGHIIDVKHDARKAEVSDIQSTALNQLNILSSTAAEGTPVQASEAIATAAELINRHQAHGIFNPLQAETHRIKFRNDALEKNMTFLALSNPEELYKRNLEGQYKQVEPVKRLEIMEKAARVQSEARSREHALTADAKEIVLRDAYSQAGLGTLPESFLAEAELNHNPLVSPQDAYHLRERNEKAPSSVGNAQVGRIMDNLFSGDTTVARIKEARGALVNFSNQLGHPNHELSKALDHLSSLIRSENSVEAQQTTAKITATKEEMRSLARPTMQGPLGAIQKNRQIQQENEAATKIRKGVPPQEVLKQQQEREAERRKNRSVPSQTIEELNKRLGR